MSITDMAVTDKVKVGTKKSTVVNYFFHHPHLSPYPDASHQGVSQ